MSAVAKIAYTQVSRIKALPKKLVENPLRTALLEIVRTRNTCFDGLFYNVGAISNAEARSISPWLATEGVILVVPPSDEGQVEIYRSLDEFVGSDRTAVDTIAIAGVGSSALGAAAFARDVANALGKPVLAIVSGYGLSDVITEALGGYFWFGGLNSLRHLFEGLDELTKNFGVRQTARPLGQISPIRLSRDTRTLYELLSHTDFSFNLLVGHSKGNLVVSEALYCLEQNDPLRMDALAEQCRIITVSAKIGMPKGFSVADVIGEWDTFGAINSRNDIKTDYSVPRKWHSTAPKFPFGLGIDVTAEIKNVLSTFDWQAERVNADPAFSSVGDLPQFAVGASVKLLGEGAVTQNTSEKISGSQFGRRKSPKVR